jgi:hypothetical protein
MFPLRKNMATNTGDGYRKGAVGSKECGNPRSQVATPSGCRKRDGEIGKFIDGKKGRHSLQGSEKRKITILLKISVLQLKAVLWRPL